VKDEFYTFSILYFGYLIEELMKLRHTILLAIIAVFLAACTFTLAEDVTPPPNYVEPSPMPTMGPLYPASAPNAGNGAAIYVEKCAPCHGDTGMGDGPQGKQLPVTVAALGLPATAQKALPSAWYSTVTQGNIDRFMPPFASLNDQERWDVVAYALTLHTTPDQMELGKSLFEANCTDCAQLFSNQTMMSALSENDIIQMVKEGAGDIPAFGSNLTEDETLAVAAYIRSLTFFVSPHAVLTAVPATEAVVAADSGTPSAEITPLAEGTPQAETTPLADVTPEATVEAAAVAGMGKVSGSIENQTGADLPSDTKVTLRGFEHGGDMNSAPAEIVTLESVVNPDGTFVFENVEILESRIYLAEVSVDGLSYQSEFAVVEAGMTDVSLVPITVHATTEDFSVLKIESLEIFFDLANADTAQIFAVYSIVNTSDKTVVVTMADETIPFIAFPAGAEGLGYEAAQESASFLSTDAGFAMPPSETPYGLIAYASLPNTKEMTISQTALLPIGGITVLIPEGVKVDGKTLTDGGVQAMDTMNFQMYTASGLDKNESIDFTLSGAPEATAVNPDVTQNKNLLIGIGAFGVVLILAGGWLFIRDRKKREEEVDEEEDDEFEDPESLMDAIIALDDLHRAGKLSDEAYQQRRNELKDALKRKK
jgi:mono/diheme cytochrome c family protein